MTGRTGWVVALAGAVAFGAVDQYFGSLRFLVEFGRWPSTAAQVSATWLIVPFLAGWTQRSARSALAIGLVSTQAALVAYCLMTVSPFEGVAIASAPTAAAAMAQSNLVYVVAGLVTGPVYGWLGLRWRETRWVVSAALVIGALCFEPLARASVGRTYDPVTVWQIEVLVGLAVAVAFGGMVLARRRQPA
ncbi:MAG TPA: DUF6518 family protein [Gaiellales bacterium]